MENQSHLGRTLSIPYEEAVSRVTEALKQEGFGILTEIDVRQTLHEKLGIEMDPYRILGACNPALAHRALEQEPMIGLVLPCNVVVRTVSGGSRIEIADPQATLGSMNNPQLDAIAAEAKQRLQRVLDALD
jgi:uncharacterized protein (DUF302 family)